MAIFTTGDGTSIFYRDWGTGQPVLFSHGWPLSGDAWAGQMQYLVDKGYRVIAHDRRGHGRSDQPSDGNVMDRYADDLAELIESLDLRDVVLVGHSTGGGEVVRYIGRHGTGRVAGLVPISAIPPLMLKTDTNSDGVPKEVFDGIRSGVLNGRSQFYRDLAEPFFGANRPGSDVAQGTKDEFWLVSMQCGIKTAYECVAVFSETDLTEDLKRIDVPTLFIHGDDDQIVPFANSAAKGSKIVSGSTLKVYPGAPHGIPQTHQDQVNTDLLAFIEGLGTRPASASQSQAEPALAPTQ